MKKYFNNMPASILLSLPVLVYFLSYVYLAIYHQKIWLFNAVVHEGGLYTLFESIFYAAHFLGHIPVHVVLSLIFVGTLMCLEEQHPSRLYNPIKILILLGIFLVFSYWLSLTLFGLKDTLFYLSQKKQSVVTYGEGGSWNLHLPSTVVQIFLIPLYLIAAKLIFGKKITLNAKGLAMILFSVGLIFVMTFLVNKTCNPIGDVWTHPKYLAHSVRELATFPLTYYPIPLYFIFRKLQSHKEQTPLDAIIKQLVLILAVILAAGIGYQVLSSLNAGVGALAQKPGFAKCGELSIFYLLASHYFEHFLDTIFFSLVCIYLYSQFAYEKNLNNPRFKARFSPPFFGSAP